MNTHPWNLWASLALFFALAIYRYTAVAQTAIVSYQGRVTANGTNFTGTGRFEFALVTSTNNNHSATATANLTGGFVTGYATTYGGNGYVVAPAVQIAGGGGSGATAHAVISRGVVTSVAPANCLSGRCRTRACQPTSRS